MNQETSVTPPPVELPLPEAARASDIPVPTNHPLGFFFIFWGEFAERCSYYGMRAILFLYLTSALSFEREFATSTYSYFKAAAYSLPLLGGFLADRFFGKYWTIVGFSIPYVLGHFVLGITTPLALFIALALLAGGSGVIKPNISTLLGKTYDQKRPGQKALLTSAFLWFYFSVNVGATLSMFALPQLRDHFVDSYLTPYDLKEETPAGSKTGRWFATMDGVRREISSEEVAALKVQANRYAYPLAFQIPAWLMVGALGAFAFGKRYYAVEVINRHQTSTPEERAQRWAVLAQLFGVFGLLVFFWLAYEQNDNLWTAFAQDHISEKVIDPATGKQVDTCVVRLGGWSTFFPPDGFQFINSLLIIILVPFAGVMWRKIDPHGTRFPPTRKIFMGFIWTAGASAVMALAAYEARDGASVSAWWMVLGYFVLTVGEILVYATGLELSYTAAPENMKGFVTACFLLTNTLGNLVNSQLSPLYKKDVPETNFFAMTAGIVLLASIGFLFVGRRFNRPAAVPVPASA